MSEAKQLVDIKIGQKKVMVFSKSYCPYCTKAKKYLRQHVGKEITEDEYDVLEIEGLDNCDQIQAYLRKMTGASSVPRVFVNGKCIGGGDETESLHKSGQLAKILS